MRFVIVAALIILTATAGVRSDEEGDRSPKDRPSPLAAPFDAQQAKASQEAWAKSLGKSSPVEKNSIEMELVLIPPGKFRMGSPATEKGREKNENQVEVTLTKGLYLGKTEVTQGQWKAVMGSAPWTGQQFAREGDKYAATYVSWEDAQAFCKKLSEMEKAEYRLPTEAEWEYACRAGTTTRFSFGDDESQLGHYAWWGGFYGDGNSKDENYAHEVGLKTPNPFGLHDMHGNAWELCEDVYTDKLPGGPDPLVSNGGPNRMPRGGGWFSDATYCRSGFRYGFPPGLRFSFCGFRVARNPGQ